jgi:MoaA/NifB/PqqE/SkfB family radical SAM enzyme
VEWNSVLLQAKDLGAKSVWIPGSGEPLLDPVFCDGRSFPLLELCKSLGLPVTFFTNGTLLTEELVATLSELDVSVVTKLNSFVPEIQDYLAGMDGAHVSIMRGLHLLMSAGLAVGRVPRLGIDTVIVRQNYREIADIFRFCRDRNIIPYITANLHGGRACLNRKLDVSSKMLRELFERLLSIDRHDYGYDWFPSPPIVGGQCKKLFYDIVVDPVGDVLLCPGIDLPIGNVRESSLEDILSASDLLGRVRGMPDTLVGECRMCGVEKCAYGCRLEAWANGDLFGPDPLCWYSEENVADGAVADANSTHKGPNSEHGDA